MNDEDFYNNIHNYLKEWEEFKDLSLTHKKLNQLQFNWNSLREWLEKENEYSDYRDVFYREHMGYVLDKMSELEGKDN